MRTERRTLAIAVGLLAVIAPGKLISYSERLAFETPDAGRLRLWTIPITRLEGAAFVWLLGRRRGPPAGVERALAAVGFVLALAPRTVVELALAVAYENADDLEVKGWVVPVTRLLGACYVAVGLFSRPAGGPTDTAVEDRRERR
ncbi:hypothetical protein [Natrinema salsiterrestre]|uniref:Uncharacterized protein n=1 Tax=Natrinema salsiterrestre TaxID=2950540 RepID=A0A9Q4Q1L8_9EURY|nr:hypothetical protein [Natrinema salsiterrestre]MDF9747404.1 hypothetical protein [Natrinema salsiterrestre]